MPSLGVGSAVEDCRVSNNVAHNKLEASRRSFPCAQRRVLHVLSLLGKRPVAGGTNGLQRVLALTCARTQHRGTDRACMLPLMTASRGNGPMVLTLEYPNGNGADAHFMNCPARGAFHSLPFLRMGLRCLAPVSRCGGGTTDR